MSENESKGVCDSAASPDKENPQAFALLNNKKKNERTMILSGVVNNLLLKVLSEKFEL